MPRRQHAQEGFVTPCWAVWTSSGSDTTTFRDSLPEAPSTSPIPYTGRETNSCGECSQRQSQLQDGLYGQEQMEVAHFTVVAGVRVDFTAQDTFDNLASKSLASQRPHAFSGHAGVSYHVAGFAPYFSYSTSFLPTLGSDVNGKPYVPMTGSNLEGGVKYQFTWVPLMLRVAGFSLRRRTRCSRIQLCLPLRSRPARCTRPELRCRRADRFCEAWITR